MDLKSLATNFVILSVSFFAVEDAFDFDEVAVVAKEDAVVLGAQTDKRRRDVFQLFGRAFAGDDVAAKSLKNLESDSLLDAADVALRLGGPDNALSNPVKVRGSSFPSRPG